MSNIGILRAILDDELLTMLKWRNAPTTRAKMFTRHEISLGEHLEWWARIRNRADLTYLMYERENQPLGIVGFTQIDRENKNSSWLFYASPNAPTGTGPRMEVLALDYAFGSLELHKLYCEVLDINKAVIKLHQKFGFRPEGVFRAQHLYDGKYVDVHRFGIFAEEWRAQRQNILTKLQSKQGG